MAKKLLPWNKPDTVPSKPYAEEYLLHDGKMSALATFEPPVGWTLLDLEDTEFDVKSVKGWLPVVLPKARKTKKTKAVDKTPLTQLQSAAASAVGLRSTVLSHK